MRSIVTMETRRLIMPRRDLPLKTENWTRMER